VEGEVVCRHTLGDGFHRVLAARKAGLSELAAEVRAGTQRDAMPFGICANNAHGLPRSNADKRYAVTLVLAKHEWSQWSDRETARRVQAGHASGSRIRRSACVSKRQMGDRKVRRGDTVYEMNVSPKKAPDNTTTTETLPTNPVPPTDPLGIPCPRGDGKCSGRSPTFKKRTTCSTD
jgi:hypothetical protein